MDNKQRHNGKYIRWYKEAKKIRLDHQQWNSMIDSMDKSKEKVDTTDIKTIRLRWNIGDWAVNDINIKNNLQCFAIVDGELIQYYSMVDAEKNKDSAVSGSTAYREFDKIFQEKNHISMIRAFGVLPKEECIEKQCCKSNLNVLWHDSSKQMIYKRGGYKADISSAFPFNQLGMMPDAHTRKYVSAVVEPDEEFPFAFYDNGDVAIYKELDTRSAAYHNHLLLSSANTRGEYRWTKQPEFTVLMKKSEYQFNSTVIDIYSKKESAAGEQKEYYKGVLNSFIGFLHSTKVEVKNKSSYMPHIAAVILARYIKQIVGIFDTLVSEGNQPLQVLTDSILWFGIPSAAATDTKFIGSFVYEAKNYKCISLKGGQYAMEAIDGSRFFCKHQGLAIERDLALHNVNTVEKFYDYMTSDYKKTLNCVESYDKRTHKFTMMEATINYDD